MTYCIYVHMQIHIQYTYTYTCTCTRVNQVPLFECIWCTESISICEDGWSYSWGNWHNSSFYRLEDDSCFQWWLTHNEQEGTWVRLWRFRRPIAASPEIPSEPVDSTMYSKWLHSYKCAKTVVHPQNRSWSEYVMSCPSVFLFLFLPAFKTWNWRLYPYPPCMTSALNMHIEHLSVEWVFLLPFQVWYSDIKLPPAAPDFCPVLWPFRCQALF